MSITGAHPRVCGENGPGQAWAETVAGSSPRVRGKQLGFQLLALRHGLIPACAGKTAKTMAGLGVGEAHPRVCGENATLIHSDP